MRFVKNLVKPMEVRWEVHSDDPIEDIEGEVFPSFYGSFKNMDELDSFLGRYSAAGNKEPLKIVRVEYSEYKFEEVN